MVVAGITQPGQQDPYPLTAGSTVSIRYSMTQKMPSIVYYKKDGFIKYVPASGTNPATGTCQILDIDSPPLTQFTGNLPFIYKNRLKSASE